MKGYSGWKVAVNTVCLVGSAVRLPAAAGYNKNAIDDRVFNPFLKFSVWLNKTGEWITNGASAVGILTT
jgi:hypothetical protein